MKIFFLFRMISQARIVTSDLLKLSLYADDLRFKIFTFGGILFYFTRGIPRRVLRFLFYTGCPAAPSKFYLTQGSSGLSSRFTSTRAFDKNWDKKNRLSNGQKREKRSRAFACEIATLIRASWLITHAGCLKAQFTQSTENSCLKDILGGCKAAHPVQRLYSWY